MATTKPLPAQAMLTTPGKTLAYSDYIRNGILNVNGANSTYAITASGSTQATAFQLNSPYNEVDTVTSSTGVNLPNSGGKHDVPYQFCIIYNNGANTLQVYASQGGTDTINGVAGATGISMNANSAALFASAQKGVWASIGIAGNENFGAITVNTINGLTITTSTGTLTVPNGVVVTGPATSGTVALNSPVPVAAGATLAVTAAMSNSPILLNTAAGSVATLPAATGSGNKFRFVVTTTASSNAHKILAASSSDFLNGNAVGHTAAGATLAFSAAAATVHSIQMPFAGTQPSGGFIGDWFEFIDVAANLWAVSGMYQSGTTATTPFSAATS